MEKLVIIGSGMAGGRLIEELIRLSVDYAVTVIGEEPYGNYDRIKLASLLMENEDENFWLNSPEWYRKQQVQCFLGEKAIAIDREKKEIITSQNRRLPYDKCVIATGSRPFVPSIDGVTQEGIMTFRNLDDVKRIKAYIQDKSRILVIGGGLLGLELAEILHCMGKEVVVSHLVDTLMEMQLNRDAARCLEHILKACGIQFIMNTYAIGIQRIDRKILQVSFKNGALVETEAVIINCGIRPAKELAERSGLITNNGIVVNEFLQTSDEAIFSLGECIEYRSQTYGVIAPIYEQARILARNLCGEKIPYPNSPLPPVKLKSHIDAIAMGKINEDEEDEVIQYHNPRSGIYKKMIIRDNKLSGAHLVGEDLNSDALGIYYTAGLPLPNRIEQLLFPGVHKSGTASTAVYWPQTVTVCDCNGIALKEIREAIKQYGDNFEKIVRNTRAGTSCGTCKNRIQSIIDNTFDVIVVGSGLGGLSSGATLAKNGKKVLIIEKHDKIGGYASAFHRDDYQFDVSLHNLGPINSSIAKIFDDLDLLKKINYVPFDHFQRIIFPRHNLKVPKGIDQFVQILSREFPEEEEGIKKIFNEIKYIRQGFDAFEELSLDGNPEEMISPMMAVQYPQFVELVEVTFGELMDRYLKSEELKGLVSNLWWYFGLPPSRVASILYSVPSASYFEHGGGNLIGTSQTLSNALADLILGHQGKIILNTEVKKVLVENNKAEAVITDDGEIFYADIIISNAGAKNTFLNLMNEEDIKARYRKKVANQEISLSAIQLYLGLDCNPQELNMPDHTFTAFFSYNHEENYRLILEGDYDHTFISCLNYTSFDSTTAPPGKGILNIFSLDHIDNWKNLSEREYQKKKALVSEKMIHKAEKFLPGLSRHIVVQELGTPMTMNSYTMNPEGSIYGPSQIIHQSGINRLQPLTPVRGLFIVGSSIYPGGGYPSVISSGYKTGKMILFQEKKTKEALEKEQTLTNCNP